MKELLKDLSLLLLLTVCLSVRAAVPLPPNIGIVWQYPQNTTNTVFKVYGTTNLSQSISNWPVVATFTNWTTVSPGTYSNSFFSPYGVSSYFTMNASNFWGTGPFFTPQFVDSPATNVTSQTLFYFGP